MSTKYTNTKHNFRNIKTGRQAPEYQCLPYNKTIGNMRPGGIPHHKCKFTQNAGTLYRFP